MDNLIFVTRTYTTWMWDDQYASNKKLYLEPSGSIFPNSEDTITFGNSGDVITSRSVGVQSYYLPADIVDITGCTPAYIGWGLDALPIISGNQLTIKPFLMIGDNANVNVNRLSALLTLSIIVKLN